MYFFYNIGVSISSAIIMKKPKNKFIIGVIVLIGLILFSQIYRVYSSGNVDTNSYVELVKGKAMLNDTFIQLSEKYKVLPGDSIRTVGKESLAVVEWWDGSLTRLWGETKITIWNNEVSRDYSQIHISFDLIAGKTWSNIVSFLGKDSSFTQTFGGVEAGVRGTVFEVDLENEVLNVTSHVVQLTDTAGKSYTIGENQPFSLTSFSFLELSQYISQMRDTAWVELNKKYDNDYILQLKTEFLSQTQTTNPFLFIMEIFSPKYRFLYELDNFQDGEKLQELFYALNAEQKQSVSWAIETAYQKIHFVGPEDTELYEKKLVLKSLLIEVSDLPEKENLLQYSLYDLQESMSLESATSFTSTLNLLWEHTDIVKTLDTSFLTQWLNLIPDDLENSFRKEFERIGDFFEGGIPDATNFNPQDGKELIDTTKAKIQDGKEKIEENINSGLDTLFETFTQ